MLTLLPLLTALSSCPVAEAPLTVEVNERTRSVVLRTASVALPAGGHGYGHQESEGYHQHAAITPLAPFTWPVSGWARGFQLRVFDCNGKEVSKSRLHHVLVLHMERRELMFPVYERIIALGQETEDISMPRGIGLPISKGAPLGLLAAWMPAEHEPEQVYLELTIPYLPANTTPRPVDVIPLGLDVRFEPGEGASYEIPVGRSTREREFEMPVDGKMLLAGGHLHQYATGMTLTDVATGDVLIDLKPKLDANGQVAGVDRKLYGVSGSGLKLRSGRRYRLSVTYDNPTGRVIPGAAMGIMGGLFSPKDLDRWPALDKSSAEFDRDVRMFERNGFITPASLRGSSPR